jgi:hypothetical protein
MENEKKTWNEPQLKTYGNVEEITQNGSLANSDVPEGVNNTAFSPR